MQGERYKSKQELSRGPLGTLSVAMSTERAVLLRDVPERSPWTAPMLDAWSKASSTAEKLHHPSLLAVVDVNRSPEGLLLATEYVQGVPLSVLMKRARDRKRPMPPELAQRIVLDLARAVAAAEELLAARGEARPLAWVHPEGVLVTSGDDALLADVGLALLEKIGEHSALEAYRAPELARPGGLTPAASVYSLGLLLWELVSGKEAFGEATATTPVVALRQRALAGAIPRLDLVAPATPSLVVGMVSQAIHRDPAARFPSAAAFADTLGAAVKRTKPGELVRVLNELCTDLVEKQRGSIVRPQVAATSWRPTVHPMDDVAVPEIPKAPRAIGLAAFRMPATEPPPPPAAPPAEEKPAAPAAAKPAAPPAEPPVPPLAPVPVEPMKIEVPASVPFADARAPQNTLPLLLVNKSPTPVPPRASEESVVPSTAIDADAFQPPPRRRTGLILFVLLIVTGAGVLAALAVKQKLTPEVPEANNRVPASSTPAPPIASPTSSAESAPAAAAPSASTGTPTPKTAPARRDEPRSARRKKDGAGGADWGKTEEEPAPGSDNPYTTPKGTPETPTPPAPAPGSSALGY